MQNNKTEIHLYTKHIAILAVSIVAAVLLVLASYFYYQGTQSEYNALIRDISILEGKLARTKTNIQLIDTYSASFEDLQSSGIFADEDRLLWSETLKAVAEEKKLPNLRYTINPQNQISNIGPAFASQIVLQESVMDVAAGLGHEGDFLTIIDALANLSGMLRVQECALAKDASIEIALDKTNVALSCKLSWFTLSQNTSSEANAAEDVGEPI